MGLQALILDVDGTVAETADLHRAAFNRAFDEQGLGWHWDREIFSQLFPIEFTLPKLRLFSIAAQRSGHAHVPSHEQLAKIAARKAQLFCTLTRENEVRLRPGVARLLRESRHEGLSLAAVSTSTRAEAQAVLTAALGFHTMGWFTCLKTSENAGVPAAEKSLYQAVLDDFGLKGRQAVAIEDSITGANATARCGIRTLVAPSMYTASSSFDMASLVVSDLGHPAEPFTIIKGQTGGRGFVSPALLREMMSPKAAAA